MTSIAKLKDRARKHEQKEDWKAAIEAYQQVLEAEEGEDELELELGLFNRIGDLYLRLGQTDQAVSYYEQAADKYAEAGFFNNAIALCNKALRHRPGRSQVYLKLSRLCAEQGFVTDARRWILDFAEREVKVGRVDAALEGLSDFVETSADPDVREFLAEQLATHGREDDAAHHYARAYGERMAAGQTDAAERAAKRARAIDPAIELEEAVAVARRPEPGGGIEMLSDDDDGSSGLAGLETRPDAPTPHEVEVAGVEGLESAGGAVPEAGEEAEEEAVGAPEGGELPGLEVSYGEREAAAVPEDAEDTDTLGGLETFDALDFGEEAEPAQADEEAGVGPGAEEEEPEPLPLMDEEAEPLPTLSIDTPGEEEEEEEEPEPLPMMDFGDEEPEAEPGPAAIEEAVAEEAAPEPAVAEEVSPEPAVAEEAPPEPAVAEEAAPEPAEEEALDLGDLDFGFGEETTSEPSEEEPAPAAAEAEPAEAPLEELEPAVEEPAPAEEALEALDLSVAPEEAVEPEADEAQGPVDEEAILARARELVTRDLGGEALAELGLLSAADASPDAFRQALSIVNEIARRDPDDVTAHQRRVEFSTRAGEREGLIDAYLELAAAMARTGAAAKAQAMYERVLGLEPDNATARQALGMGAAEAEGEEETVDLTAVLQEIEREEGAEEVGGEGPMVDDEAGDPAFAALLSQFKARVTENVDPEDAGDHYDLGLAFKEMGLIDEAIAEFQTALTGGEERLKVYEELGQCFVLKNQFNVALKIFNRALHVPHQDPAELLGVYYHLGQCHEELGQREQAREAYERVLAIDPSFQDVPDRMARL